MTECQLSHSAAAMKNAAATAKRLAKIQPLKVKIKAKEDGQNRRHILVPLKAKLKAAKRDRNGESRKA